MYGKSGVREMGAVSYSGERNAKRNRCLLNDEGPRKLKRKHYAIENSGIIDLSLSLSFCFAVPVEARPVLRQTAGSGRIVWLQKQ
jgi:hypothetical protein